MGYPRIIYYAAVVALGSLPTTGTADGLRGNGILTQCDKGSEDFVLPCVYWTMGVVGGIQFAEAASKVRTVCIPAGSTFGQYQDVILAYLRANPERRHLPAEAIAYAALRRAFPCAEK